ncbi:MAG: BatD family protein [Granulosicoccus sp.]
MRSTRGSQLCCSLVLIIGLLVSMQAIAQQSAVRSELSSDTITRDESVTLTITAIGLDGELDASSLTKDFEVVGRSSSRQISTVTDSNNQLVTTSVVTWALELIPKDVGVFTVPAVSVKGQKSQLLTLTVNEIPNGAKRDVFVEATVDTQAPWVQSQVTLTLKVFQAIDIVDGGLDVPSGENLVVERIGEDTRTSEVREGRQYSVTQRRFALFPQKSGRATIEPITLSVSVPADPARVRGFFSPTRKLSRRTDAISLDVQARPPSGSNWWLPAGAVQLERTWSGDPAAAEVDQPLTRSIVLRASGVLDSQLPDINIPAIEGLSLYAEQPVRAMGSNENGLVAEQRINWAIIPQRAGELVLPEITVEWFNTQTGEPAVATLPQEIINVSPASTSTSGAKASVDSLQSSAETALPSTQIATDASSIAETDRSSEQSEGLNQQASALAGTIAGEQIANLQQSTKNWRTATFTVLLLWLLTAVFFLIRRLRNPGSTGASQSSLGNQGRLGAVRGQGNALAMSLSPLAAVEASCKAGDLSSIRHSLLEWSSKQWQESAPLTLNSLGQKLPSGEAQLLIGKLDAALYSNNVDTATLVSALKELPAMLKQALSASEADKTRDTDSVNGLPSL